MNPIQPGYFRAANMAESALTGKDTPTSAQRIYKTATGKIYMVNRYASPLAPHGVVNVTIPVDYNHEQGRQEVMDDWAKRPEASQWNSPSDLTPSIGGGNVGDKFWNTMNQSNQKSVDWPQYPIGSNAQKSNIASKMGTQRGPGTINGQLV